MRVRDLMTTSLVTVGPDTSIFDAKKTMAEQRIRHLLVTDESGLLGIVTDRDIRLNLPSPATSLSVWELNYLLAKLTVRDVMTKHPITVSPDQAARDAASVMVAQKIGALPVTAHGRLIGIVTETDVVKAFASMVEAMPGAV
jgi:acetoin utilization protein AcuB